MSIQIHLKCKYTYENARFCILFIDDFEMFRDFLPRNVTGAYPPSKRLSDVFRGQKGSKIQTPYQANET